MKINNLPLFLGGIFCLIISILHVGIIIGGPDWYRFFGAGEEMAQMAETGNPYPAYLTSGIVIITGIWALYGFSGAGLIGKLPLARWVFFIVAGIFLLRGFGGIPMVWFTDHPYLNELGVRPAFMVISSLISAFGGALFLSGARSYAASTKAT
jgi:putative oxidoreductase